MLFDGVSIWWLCAWSINTSISCVQRGTGIDIHYVITRFGWVLRTIITNVQLVRVCVCMVNNRIQKDPPTILIQHSPMFCLCSRTRVFRLPVSLIHCVSQLVSQMTKCLTNYHRASIFCANTQDATLTRAHT